MKIIELKPIEESKKDYDALEARLKRFFKEYLYYPLIRELDISQKTLQNAASPNSLTQALFTGRIQYSSGKFSGKLSASISKELRALGAKFDRKTGSYALPEKDLPYDMRAIVQASEQRFLDKMAKLDAKLARIVPEELAENFKCADIFDRQIYQADQSFKKNVKKIAVVQEIPKEQRERISREWQDNMKLHIKGWTEDQIKDLRKKIYQDILGGARRESLVPGILKITKTIQDSHEEALNKAKFLARQESRLLMASLKQARYEAVGSHGYIWRCVHRPHDTDPKQHTPGNVRYAHAQLNGTEQKWNAPPITTNPGEPVRRNHPGQDYNCRCFSRPLLAVK